MNSDEKRQVMKIAGAGIGLCLLAAVLVIALDVRSLVQNNRPQVESAVSEAVGEALPFTRPRFDEQGNFIEYEEDFQLPRDVEMRGQLLRGATVSGTVGMYHQEGWAIDGHKGDHYLLDFEATSGGYTWAMAVYQPNRDRLALTMDSEAGYADFSLLPIDLPEDGIYTVVISAFGEDGGYTLTMR